MRQYGLLAFAAFLLVGQQVSAQQMAVDLELVLAADISISMTENERSLQLEGYASAFRDRDVISAIMSGPRGRIAVSYVEWASSQRVVVPWTIVANRFDAMEFAAAIAEAPITGPSGTTNITSAIEFSAALIGQNDFASSRLVIDISGDGANNSGVPSDSARDAAVGQGITINGLPLHPSISSPGARGELPADVYYRDYVIGGPGAFLVVADGPGDFIRAIRLKILREIAAR